MDCTCSTNYRSSGKCRCYDSFPETNRSTNFLIREERSLILYLRPTPARRGSGDRTLDTALNFELKSGSMRPIVLWLLLHVIFSPKARQNRERKHWSSEKASKHVASFFVCARSPSQSCLQPRRTDRFCSVALVNVIFPNTADLPIKRRQPRSHRYCIPTEHKRYEIKKVSWEPFFTRNVLDTKISRTTFVILHLSSNSELIFKS